MSDTPDRTFFTSAKDCVLWTAKFLAVLFVLLAGFWWVQDFRRSAPVQVLGETAWEVLLLWVGASVAFGLLLFFFGWLGRVTISNEGIEGPLYSGAHRFIGWSDIDNVAAGSLNGWPCAVVRSRRTHMLVYIMVIGPAKTRMIECIRRYATADNPLSEYYSHHGA
jgi:hypothetical protein